MSSDDPFSDDFSAAEGYVKSSGGLVTQSPICEVCKDSDLPVNKWGVCVHCHTGQDCMMHPHKIHNRMRIHTVIHKTGHRYDVVQGTFTIGPDSNVVFAARKRGQFSKHDMVSLMISDISAIVEEVK